MDDLLLKPDKSKNYRGFEKINGLNFAKTNVKDRKYDYLLSLMGIKKAETTFENGILYLSIGNGNPPKTDCKEHETVIEIGNGGITVSGRTSDEISNGVKMLIDMYASRGKTGYFPIGEFRYVPKIKLRAVHMCLFDPDDGTQKEDTNISSVRRRIETAALSGYNSVILEFWGMFPYEKREYAHWRNCHSRESVEKLISFIIDDLHMTAIPCQNLTSHAGWSRITSRRHVVLDQCPDLSDMYIPGGWCFATTREDTKAFLRDIMDDLVKTFRNPPLFHCSCDKCFGFGSSEEERVLPADDLFVNHLKFLRDELEKRGARMAMWADMLYSSIDVKYWKCSEGTADRLPKDILMNIWTHNDIGNGEWKDITYFEDKGFETAYSPWINKDGAKNMVEQCLKHNSLGIIQTTWHKPETALPTVVYTGGYMWSAKEPSAETVKSHVRWKNV